MSDLIRREDVAEALYQAIRTTLTGTFTDSMSLAIVMANNLPSAEEPERKKGKWIEQDDGWGGTYYECSCCGEAFVLIDGTPADNLYNFCPSCGARLEWK